MIVIKFCLVTLFVLGLAGCEDEQLPPVPPRAVMTMRITPSKVETFGPFGSVIEARYETRLGFQTSGRMISRGVDVGDAVRGGQELASVDPTLAQFALVRAKADVADARALVESTQGTASRKQVLARSGASPQSALDSAVANLATAEANLEQKQAALRNAEDVLGYTRLHANFDGVVTAWSAEIGQYVNDGQAVVTIARPDVREAVVDVPDALISGVRPAMEFTVHLQSAPQVTAKARVREIGPLADSSTRSHRVRMTLEDPDTVFRIGTTITVENKRTISPRIMVPNKAVLVAAGKHYVWTLSKDAKVVSRREVEIGGSNGDQVVVMSGLSAGDQLIVVGVHSVHEGQVVAGEADAANPTDMHL